MDPSNKIHYCSLCGLEFEGSECHSACPMSRGCKMVECPRCGFEFVDESRIVNFVQRLFRHKTQDQLKIEN